MNGIDARLIEAEPRSNANDFAAGDGGTRTPFALRRKIALSSCRSITRSTRQRHEGGGVDQSGERRSGRTAAVRRWATSPLDLQYCRTQDNVFPYGPFFKGGNYGTDVNFPVHVDEQNNPEFKGCADRAA